MKFKVGDRVKCVSCGVYPDLIEGKIYTVKAIFFPLVGGMLGGMYVLIMNEKNYSDYYHEDLFKKILFNFTKKRLLK